MNYFIYFTSSKIIVFGNPSWQESESKPITDYLDSYATLFVLFLFLFFSRNSPCRERFLNSAKAHQSAYSELTRLTLFKTQDPENHIVFSGTYPFRTNEGYHLRAANKIQLTFNSKATSTRIPIFFFPNSEMSTSTRARVCVLQSNFPVHTYLTRIFFQRRRHKACKICILIYLSR